MKKNLFKSLLKESMERKSKKIEKKLPSWRSVVCLISFSMRKTRFQELNHQRCSQEQWKKKKFGMSKPKGVAPAPKREFKLLVIAKMAFVRSQENSFHEFMMK